MAVNIIESAGGTCISVIYTSSNIHISDIHVAPVKLIFHSTTSYIKLILNSKRSSNIVSKTSQDPHNTELVV